MVGRAGPDSTVLNFISGGSGPIGGLSLPGAGAGRRGAQRPAASRVALIGLGVILYLASDLVWATKIKAMAEDLGLAARPVRTLEMLEARLGNSAVNALILDLEKPEEALAMLARLRGPGADDRARGIRTLAFGPHVAKETLQSARDAGADEVMPRGAFDHHLSDILLGLAGRA